jgi:hypothetical protein
MSGNAQLFKVTGPHRSTYSTIVIGDITFKKLMSIRSLIHAIDFMDASPGGRYPETGPVGGLRASPTARQPLKKLILGRKYDPARYFPCTQFRQHLIGFRQGAGYGLRTNFSHRRHFQ